MFIKLFAKSDNFINLPPLTICMDNLFAYILKFFRNEEPENKVESHPGLKALENTVDKEIIVEGVEKDMSKTHQGFYAGRSHCGGFYLRLSKYGKKTDGLISLYFNYPDLLYRFEGGETGKHVADTVFKVSSIVQLPDHKTIYEDHSVSPVTQKYKQLEIF